MFKLIEPKDHSFYQTAIESLLGLLKVYQHFELSLQEKSGSIFIIAEDCQRGVYGGVVLRQKKVSSLQERMKNIISTFHPDREEVWTATLCLCVELNESFSSLSTLELSQNFYRNLHKVFLEFGHKVEERFLCLTLSLPEYFKMKKYGNWSYAFEVYHQESLDRRFHGILSLADNLSLSHIKTGVTMGSQETKLAA